VELDDTYVLLLQWDGPDEQTAKRSSAAKEAQPAAPHPEEKEPEGPPEVLYGSFLFKDGTKFGEWRFNQSRTNFECLTEP
jgi:hypothetical protein